MNLPDGWTLTTLGEVSAPERPLCYGVVQPGEDAPEGVPLIRVCDLENGKVRIDGLRRIPKDVDKSYGRSRLIGEEVLISVVGTIGRTAIAQEECAGMNIARAIARLAPVEQVESSWIKCCLDTARMQSMLSQEAREVARKTLNLHTLSDVQLPVPPLNEQRRIVARIEELTVRSKAAREALQAIPPLLERFRQSVLAAAFRGDLTAEWRRQNPDVEPDWFSNLNQEGQSRIEVLTARKHRYWGSGDVTTAVESRELPVGWRWTSVRELGFDQNTVVQIGPMSMESKDFSESGVRVLNVGCVQWGHLDMSKCNYLPPGLAQNFQRYSLEAGDVMFTRSGTVGRSAVIPIEVAGSLMTFHLLRVRTSSELCLPSLLFYAFQGCPEVLKQVNDSAMGATRAGFNTKLLEGIHLPLPPPAEQGEIVRQLDNAFAEIESIEEILRRTVSRQQTLDQSILAKAFRGELVPQDPTDEPASVLLDRIRAEQTLNEGTTKPRGKRGKA